MPLKKMASVIGAGIGTVLSLGCLKIPCALCSSLLPSKEFQELCKAVIHAFWVDNREA
jgi:hypothetical protein